MTIIGIGLQVVAVFLLLIIVIQLFTMNKQQRIVFSSSNRFRENQLDQHYKTIQKYLKTEETEITDQELQLINTNEELRYALNMVLNYFEELSSAYNMGLLDKKYAYISFSEPIFYAYTRYKKRIDYVRMEAKDISLLNQLEKTYRSMKKIKAKEISRQRKKSPSPSMAQAI